MQALSVHTTIRPIERLSCFYIALIVLCALLLNVRPIIAQPEIEYVKSLFDYPGLSVRTTEATGDRIFFSAADLQTENFFGAMSSVASDPIEFDFLISLPDGHENIEFHVQEPYLFILSENEEDNVIRLWKIDCSVPDNPVILSRRDLELSSAYGFEVYGPWLYVISHERMQILSAEGGGFEFFTTIPGDYDQASFIHNGHLINIRGDYDEGSFISYDLTNPLQPVLNEGMYFEHSHDHRQIAGDHLYMADYDGSVFYYDISDPSDISYEGQIAVDFGGNLVGQAAVGDKLIFITSREAYFIDISNPVEPEYMGASDIDSFEIAVSDEPNQFFFFNNSNHMVRLIDVSDLSQPEVVAKTVQTTMPYVTGFKLKDDLLVIQTGDGCLFYNVSDPLNPIYLSAVDTHTSVHDVAFYQNYLFTATGSISYVIDITDPAIPSIAGTIDMDDPMWAIAIHEDLLSISDNFRINYYDLSPDPFNPVYVGRTAIPAEELFVAEPFLFGIRPSGTNSRVFSVYIGGDEPVNLDSRQLLFQAGDSDLKDSVLAVSSETHGLTLVDIRTPNNIQLYSAFPGFLYILESVSLAGAWAALGGWEGVWLLDISDPTQPELIGRWLGQVDRHIQMFESGVIYATEYSAFHILNAADLLDLALPPQDLTAVLVDSIEGLVDLSWTAPQTDPPPSGYKIARNGEFIVEITETAFIDQLPEWGDYSYSVRAVFVNAQSSSVTFEQIEWLAPVDIQLTRLSNGVIQEHGGWIQADAELNCHLGVLETVTLRALVLSPDGEVQVLQSIQLQLTPGQELNWEMLAVYVPAGASGGVYQIGLRAYRLNDELLGGDSFTFTKLQPIDGDSEESWEMAGLHELAGDAAAATKTGTTSPMLVLDEIVPNPTNAGAIITVRVFHELDATVTVYNTLGQRVTQIFDGRLTQGVHQWSFDERHLASGLYFVSVESSFFNPLVRKMMLLQ